MIFATLDTDSADRICVDADIHAFTDRPAAEAWLLENDYGDSPITVTIHLIAM